MEAAKMIYFTADTHFYHTNIIRICNRPFENIEAMHESLIENWNSIITNQDDIYILGDFVFKGKGQEANEILKTHKGKKYLIKGNHDKYLNDPDFKPEAFQWIKDYHVLSFEKRKFILFHYPILEWDGFFHDAIHLYGHVHNSREKNLEYQERFKPLGKKAINVGIDVHNFYPVSIKRIIEMADEASLNT
jgi:calcineurin-like phosphoesterase family protein